MQVEFVMLDPYICTKLQHNEQVRLTIAFTCHFLVFQLELLLTQFSLLQSTLVVLGCRGIFTQPSRFLMYMVSTSL